MMESWEGNVRVVVEELGTVGDRVILEFDVGG